MKRIKFLNGILSSTILCGAVLPIVCCSKDTGQNNVSLVSSQIKKYMHATEQDPYPVFVLKLKDKLNQDQKLNIEVKDVAGTKGVSCSISKFEIKDTLIYVYMKMDGFMYYGEYCMFSLQITCNDSNGNKVWTSSHSGFKLTSAHSFNYYVNNLYERTIEEFIEWSKNPHPSNPKETHTLEDDTLNIARNYLQEKISFFGYPINRDTYGNIWFDVPATNGYSKYPQLIIQGHMDMVTRGFATELEERTIGIDVARTFTKDGKHEVLQSKGTANPDSGFRKTSLGADDGISIAIVLALLTNSNFEHGPLRIIFTSDEETGMYGVANLDPSIINSDYLLCLDGEGDSTRPISISKSCYGFNNYEYTKHFTPISKTLNNVFTFTISGFKGKHFYSNIHYTDQGPQLFGNPDALIWQALYDLTHNDNKYKVEFNKYSHQRGEDEKREARNMPRNATVTFATNATKKDVEDTFKKVIDEAKNKYKLEDWEKGITNTVSEVTDTSKLKFISSDDSAKLIQVFGKDIVYDVQHWDGDDIEDEAQRKKEMIERDYPTQCCNFSYTEIDDNCVFTGFSRANAASQKYIDELDQKNAKGWTDQFGNEGLKKLSTHGPWDPSGKEELLNLTKEGYESIGEKPVFSRVRGGVEPAYFCKYRPTLQQTVIGPWLENIHDVKETLYLETLTPVIKCVLFIIDNMWRFTK